jgi:hypothetical protein
MSGCTLLLLLLLDASGSVDDLHWPQQIEAHAEAFEHPAVISAIAAAGPIVVRAAHYSDVLLPLTGWREISSAAEAHAFARELRGAERVLTGDTRTGEAIAAGVAMLSAGPGCDAAVIDLVTDGPENAGRPTAQARDEAAAVDVRINALGIATDRGDPTDWLRENAETPGGFTVRAAGWWDMALALRRKIVREIAEARQ